MASRVARGRDEIPRTRCGDAGLEIAFDVVPGDTFTAIELVQGGVDLCLFDLREGGVNSALGRACNLLENFGRMASAILGKGATLAMACSRV